jgi:hypothetical protein
MFLLRSCRSESFTEQGRMSPDICPRGEQQISALGVDCVAARYIISIWGRVFSLSV